MKRIISVLFLCLCVCSVPAQSQKVLTVVDQFGSPILFVSDTAVSDGKANAIFSVVGSTVYADDGTVVMKITEGRVTGEGGKLLYTVRGNKVYIGSDKVSSAVFTKEAINGDSFSYGILNLLSAPSRRQQVIATCILLMVHSL